MTRARRRTNEPGRWALFAAGGQIAALTVPALALVLGLLVPLGVLGEPDAVFERLHGFFANPLGSALVFAALGLILWHCTHRIVHGVHDCGVTVPRVVRNVTYLAAAAIPLIGWALAAL